MLTITNPPMEEYDVVNFNEIEGNIVEMDLNNITADQLRPGVTYIQIEPGVYQEIILREDGNIDQRRVIVRELVSELPERYRTIIRASMFEDLE